MTGLRIDSGLDSGLDSGFRKNLITTDCGVGRDLHSVPDGTPTGVCGHPYVFHAGGACTLTWAKSFPTTVNEAVQACETLP